MFPLQDDHLASSTRTTNRSGETQKMKAQLSRPWARASRCLFSIKHNLITRKLNFRHAGWILAAALSWSLGATAGERTLVAAKSDADYDALRSEAVKSGARILKDLRQIRLLVVDADRSTKA